MIKNMEIIGGQFKTLIKNKDKVSKFAKILIDNYPSLSKNVNHIVECTQYLVKHTAK